MDRLLSILFSVVLLMANYPTQPMAFGCGTEEACAPAEHLPCAPKPSGDDDPISKCPLRSCCVCGPCSCLCLVPEPPELPRHAFPDEQRVTPASFIVFVPQQAGSSIWKPPAQLV